MARELWAVEKMAKKGAPYKIVRVLFYKDEADEICGTYRHMGRTARVVRYTPESTDAD